MFCKKCGAELRLNAKFCAKCGTPAPAKAPEIVKPVKPAETVKPEEEVKTVLTREEPEKKAIYVPPTEVKAEPKEAPKEAPKLVITMGDTKASSSNGQFNEWFSDPGDL